MPFLPQVIAIISWETWLFQRGGIEWFISGPAAGFSEVYGLIYLFIHLTNLQPGLQNFPGRGCGWAAGAVRCGAVPLRGAGTRLGPRCVARVAKCLGVGSPPAGPVELVSSYSCPRVSYCPRCWKTSCLQKLAFYWCMVFIFLWPQIKALVVKACLPPTNPLLFSFYSFFLFNWGSWDVQEFESKRY